MPSCGISKWTERPRWTSPQHDGRERPTPEEAWSPPPLLLEKRKSKGVRASPFAQHAMPRAVECAGGAVRVRLTTGARGEDQHRQREIIFFLEISGGQTCRSRGLDCECASRIPAGIKEWAPGDPSTPPGRLRSRATETKHPVFYSPRNALGPSGRRCAGRSSPGRTHESSSRHPNSRGIKDGMLGLGGPAPETPGGRRRIPRVPTPYSCGNARRALAIESSRAASLAAGEISMKKMIRVVDAGPLRVRRSSGEHAQPHRRIRRPVAWRAGEGRSAYPFGLPLLQEQRRR